MISKLVITAAFALVSFLPPTGHAADSAGQSASFCAGKSFYLTDTGLHKLLRFSAEGKMEWEYGPVYSYDLQLLANGNLLFCDSAGKSSRTVELDPKTKTAVWEYKSTGEVFSCKRLANGNTLVGECSNGRIVEVDAKGAVIRTIPLTATHKGHGSMRLFEPAAAGTVWVAHMADKCLRQYDNSGKVLRTVTCPFAVFGVLPLADGRVMACGQGAVVEFDAAGKMTPVKNADFAGEHVFVTGLEKLPNGNLLVTQWLGHGQEGKGIPGLELTPERQTAWRFADVKQTKQVVVIRMIP